MRKVRAQRAITSQILDAAPQLKYIAFYHSSDDRLNASMRDYENRSFVYVLTAVYGAEEYFLYVGKSKAQYSRYLMHNKKYSYDHLYLFECNAEVVLECEAAVIRKLKPLFNRAHNPDWKRTQLLLGVNYDEVQTNKKIRRYLKRYESYKRIGLFGFALPVALFATLEKEASENGCNCSEYLQKMLEDVLMEKLPEEIDKKGYDDTNLVNTKTYAEMHRRSEEQIKQYLRQKTRIAGAMKVGRNYVMPRDSKFPEDHRGKRRA